MTLSQGPLAMGAHGPEILGYELEGLGLEAQGITSGPMWDRASSTLLSINGEDRSRLRRLVSKAFTPRAVGRLDTVITVEDIARPYPVPVNAELLGAPSEDWKLFSG